MGGESPLTAKVKLGKQLSKVSSMKSLSPLSMRTKQKLDNYIGGISPTRLPNFLNKWFGGCEHVPSESD
jgi:hypothetical protein